MTTTKEPCLRYFGGGYLDIDKAIELIDASDWLGIVALVKSSKVTCCHAVISALYWGAFTAHHGSGVDDSRRDGDGRPNAETLKSFPHIQHGMDEAAKNVRGYARDQLERSRDEGRSPKQSQYGWGA